MSKEITYEQASKLLGISLAGVYDAVTRGKLHPIQKPGIRSKFLDKDEVIKYGKLDRRSFIIIEENTHEQDREHNSGSSDIDAIAIKDAQEHLLKYTPEYLVSFMKHLSTGLVKSNRNAEVPQGVPFYSDVASEQERLSGEDAERFILALISRLATMENEKKAQMIMLVFMLLTFGSIMLRAYIDKDKLEAATKALSDEEIRTRAMHIRGLDSYDADTIAEQAKELALA